MQFHIISIFPEMFSSFLKASLIGKAVESGLVSVNFVDPRDFTEDRHRSVDDTPFGGGDGMVMKPEPLVNALESVEALESISEQSGPPLKVLLTPQGEPLKQKHMRMFCEKGNVALLCGRYEGFDERVRGFVDEEISLGDFVLNGGEVAAMAIMDGVARLVPGVIGNSNSLVAESFSEDLLEYPQYTKPREFRGMPVPKVLLNGNHKEIQKWRESQMEERTQKRRPDLWKQNLVLRKPEIARKTYVALLHHPVYDRQGEVVTTAITNLDLHDIARSARTYGLAGYYVVTPLTSQQELANRILSHWKKGHGAATNEKRKEALSLVNVAPDLLDVISQVERKHGEKPLVIATTAQKRSGQLGVQSLVTKLNGAKSSIILMGTGWGLEEGVFEMADMCLRPVAGVRKYNHLSVRCATAILLDRLFGMGE